MDKNNEPMKRTEADQVSGAGWRGWSFLFFFCLNFLEFVCHVQFVLMSTHVQDKPVLIRWCKRRSDRVRRRLDPTVRWLIRPWPIRNCAAWSATESKTKSRWPGRPNLFLLVVGGHTQFRINNLRLAFNWQISLKFYSFVCELLRGKEATLPPDQRLKMARQKWTCQATRAAH